MSSMTIRLYELDLDVEYNLFPEEGDNWESQYFAGEIEITGVLVSTTDISLMMLLTDEQFTKIEDEINRVLTADSKDYYDVPDED